MSRINVIFCGATCFFNAWNPNRIFYIGSYDGNTYYQPHMFKSDLLFFKKMTINKVIVMGRNTWSAIGEKPLPNRVNVVITSQPETIQGALAFTSIKEVLDYFKPNKELFFIGGAKLIKELVQHYRVHTFYITSFVAFHETNVSIELNLDGYKPKLIKIEDDTCIITKETHKLFFEKYTKI